MPIWFEERRLANREKYGSRDLKQPLRNDPQISQITQIYTFQFSTRLLTGAEQAAVSWTSLFNFEPVAKRELTLLLRQRPSTESLKGLSENLCNLRITSSVVAASPR
jgi:hypothetical protein